MSKKKGKGTQLKWVTIQGNQLGIVPVYLIEQVRPRPWEVERLYRLAPLLTSSPFNVMGVFVDKANTVKGFMWGTANPLDEKFHVHVLTVDKEYQGRGIIGEAAGILNKIKKETNTKSLTFQTIYPEKFEPWGFKRSELLIMEE